MSEESKTRDTKNRDTHGNLVGNRTRDALLFLFFVLVCFIFWMAQRLEETFTQEITMPVRLTDVPQDLIITTDIASEMKLAIRAKGVDILPYLLFNKSTDTLYISASLYAGHERAGRTLILNAQLQKLAKDLLPSQATIASISPDTLSFYYNRGLPKRFPVRVAGTLTAKDQYCIVGCDFTPDSVSVYAPQHVLDTMSAVYTTPLYLTGLDKTEEQEVSLTQKPGICTRPTKAVMRTRVDILTGQSLEIPVVAINFPADKTLRTFPSTVHVVYRVPNNMAGTIRPEDFTVVISYAELLDNTSGRCRPHINQMPEGVVGARIDPVEVEFLLENIKAEEEAVPTPKKKK